MKRDKVLVLILIVLVLMLIAVVLFVSKNHNKTSNSLKSDANDGLTNKGIELIDKINKLDDKSLILITNVKGSDRFIQTSKSIVDYYIDIYKFDHIEFNIKDYSKKDLEEVYKIIGITESNLPTPTLVLYSKENTGYIVNFFLEDDLRKMLILKKYVAEEDFNNDYVINGDVYDKVANSDVFVYLDSNYKNYYKYRKYIYNNYNNKIIMYSSALSCNYDICKLIKDKISDTDSNVLYLVRNNEIVDYVTNIKSESNIDSFFKKNNVL